MPDNSGRHRERLDSIIFFHFAQQGGGESEFLLDAEPLEELRKDDG